MCILGCMDIIDPDETLPLVRARMPWSSWADGQVREAREGTDMVDAKAFIHAGQQWAPRHGLRFAYRTAPEAPGKGLAIWFQIVPK